MRSRAVIFFDVFPESCEEARAIQAALQELGADVVAKDCKLVVFPKDSASFRVVTACVLTDLVKRDMEAWELPPLELS